MNKPRVFFDGRVMLHAGDCLDVLALLPENSVDAVVTDPPYHLTSIVKRFGGDAPPRTEAAVGKHAFGRHAAGFMGKIWDGGDIAFRVETWQAVLRVLKPGGYILAFASTRGFGRMSVAIEDAGFNTHPMIGWIFGQGFPKATRIRAEGFEGQRYGGQSLKPALEPIYMGQKPFSEENGTANILRWGTGAVNIDACRISTDESTRRHRLGSESQSGWERGFQRAYETGSDAGRWPANLIHDGSDEVLAAFPDAPGQQQDVALDAPSARSGNVYGKMNRHGEKSADARYADRGSTDFAALPGMRRADSGSAARFFYAAKADADDRIGSKHPTVKPLDLMQYLVRLVTPKGGIVLDPFAGTGTTGEAAWREGCRAILIEREAEYQADIARRMEMATAGPNERKRRRAALTPQDALGGLFAGNAA